MRRISRAVGRNIKTQGGFRGRMYHTDIPMLKDETSLKTLSSIPEFESGKVSLKTGNYGAAVEGFSRALDVCSHVLGTGSAEHLYMNRLLLDVCYGTKNVPGGVLYASNIFEAIKDSSTDDKTSALDALRIGRFFLHVGDLRKVRSLEPLLHETTGGKLSLATAFIADREFSEGMYILEGLTSTSCPVVLNNFAGACLLEGGEEAPSAALEFLKESMVVLDKQTERNFLRAHVYCNAGVVSLISKEYDDAFRYLKESIDFYDAAVAANKEGGDDGTLKGRALAQLGAYYHSTEQAVSAEGMHRAAKEAMENAPASPRRDLIHSHNLDLFGLLLRDWDKRESEAEGIFAKALEVRNSIAGNVPDEILYLGGWGTAAARDLRSYF